MDGMVEENEAGSTGSAVESLKSTPSAQVVAATSIVQLSLPSQAPAVVQSVIQSNNQQSVIQTPSNVQSMQMPKTNVILQMKPSSVIHTTQGSLQTFQIKSEPNLLPPVKMDSGSDDSISDDENPKRKRDLLTRRPSYRKILNELGGAEIAENRLETNSSECESEVSLPTPLPFSSVIPAGALQGESGLQALSMSNAGSGGTIVQYTTSQDGQFFVPVAQGGPMLEDQSRKREMRLMKNREAARECRRKKKEYIKCLENRVAVLENQNKALIDELKVLKELYCKQKSE